MKNKPNGPGAYGGASQPDPSDEQAPRRRGEARGTPNPSESRTPEPFARVASQFRKADLMNPDKLERMIRIAVDGLVAQEFKQLSLTQRRRLAAWMRSDPLVRERLIKAFEKILS
jgi:hypothetical protein